jgi:putative endonuclease
MPHFIYILEMLTGHRYVGTTTNIERRLLDHAKGFGHKTTRLGGYKRLMYTESFPDRLSALHRERQIKGWTRAKKLALIEGSLDNLRELARKKKP